MSTLQDRLDRIKAGFQQKAPAEAQAVIARSLDELRASGLAERLPTVGSVVPAFELPDTDGSIVRSSELLARGPLVVSFYRGAW